MSNHSRVKTSIRLFHFFLYEVSRIFLPAMFGTFSTTERSHGSAYLYFLKLQIVIKNMVKPVLTKLTEES
jgi:hypothetical protein